MTPPPATATTPVPASHTQDAPRLGAGKTALILVLSFGLGAAIFAFAQYALAHGAKPTTWAQICAFAVPLIVATSFAKWLEKKLAPRK